MAICSERQRLSKCFIGGVSMVPFLSFLLLLCFALLSSCEAEPSLPYTYFGPMPMSKTGLYAMQLNPLTRTNLTAVLLSAPTLTIGITLPLTGVAASAPSGLFYALQALVDITNFRGGVWHLGQQYAVRLQLGDDQGSDIYMCLLYENMLQNDVSLFFGAYNSYLQAALNSLLPAANATFISVGANDPSVFEMNNTNLFSTLNTANLLYQPALTAINENAQYYNQLNSDSIDEGYLSPYGFTTVCMLTSNDTLSLLGRDGVLQWISNENKARLAAPLQKSASTSSDDLISIVIDDTWSESLTGTYTDLVPYLNLCPDGVDVLVAIWPDLDGAQALKASKLRPRSAVGISITSNINAQSPVTLELASGFTIPVPGQFESYLNFHGAPFHSILDVYYSYGTYAEGAGIPAAFTSDESFIYFVAWDILLGAINVSQSLGRDNMRSAILSFNGQLSIAGYLDFSNQTGVNVAINDLVLQVLYEGTNITEFTGNHSLVYPYPWPWHRIQEGDTMSASQSVFPVILATSMIVLGVWVSQILVEQSIFLRRRGNWTWILWLVVVTLSLGGAGLWCSILMQSSALSIAVQDNVQQTSFSIGVMLLAWLPCILLVFSGLIILILDHESTNTQSNNKNKSTAAAQAIRERNEAKKRSAVLSHREHLQLMMDSATWRVGLGGSLIAIAVALNRVTIWSVWVQDASITTSNWAWAVTIMLDASLIPLSMLFFFHALRWRVWAVFMFSTAVMIDWQLHMATIQFSYQPAFNNPIPSRTVSAELVQIISGVFACLLSFAFIGLQFNRMSLSRNGLSVMVISLENVINRLKQSQREEKLNTLQARFQANYMVKIVECFSLITPFPFEHAFMLALCSNLGTFQVLNGTKFDISEQKPDFPLGLARSSDRVYSKDMQSLAVRTNVKSGRADRAVRRSARNATVNDNDLVEGEISKGISKGTSANQVAPTLSPSSSAMVVKSVVPRPSAMEVEDITDKGETVKPTGRPEHILQESSSQIKSITSFSGGKSNLLKVNALAQQIAISSSSSCSLNSRQIDGGQINDWREFEDELQNLVASVESTEESRADSLSPKSKAGSRMLSGAVSSVVDDNSFELSSHLLARITRLVNPFAPASFPVSLRSPSLITILNHPICAEIIKQELIKTHSCENLSFYQQVQRYKRLQSAQLRRYIAKAMCVTFVLEGSPQQININNRQREAILARFNKTDDDSCIPELFREAERECVVLIEQGMWKKFQTTTQYRVCVWVCQAVQINNSLKNRKTDEEEEERLMNYQTESQNHESLLSSLEDQRTISNT